MNNKAHPTPTLTAYSLLSLLWSRPAWSGRLPLPPPHMYTLPPPSRDSSSPAPPHFSPFLAQPQGQGWKDWREIGRGRKEGRGRGQIGKLAERLDEMMVKWSREAFRCLSWRRPPSGKTSVVVFCSGPLWIQVQSDRTVPKFDCFGLAVPGNSITLFTLKQLGQAVEASRWFSLVMQL